jgi:hypothetical protein
MSVVLFHTYESVPQPNHPGPKCMKGGITIATSLSFQQYEQDDGWSVGEEPVVVLDFAEQSTATYAEEA